MIDYTITIGNIVEIGTIVGGGLYILVRQHGIIGFLSREVADMQNELKEIQTEIKTLTAVVTNTKLLEQRLDRAEEEIRLLRMGKGFIATEVSGEYSRFGKVIPDGNPLTK